NLDINISSPSNDLVNYAGVFINNVLGSKLSAGNYNTSSNTGTTSTGTFSLSSTGVVVGNTVTITNNCTSAPTSYTSSNTSVATISGSTITTLSAGTTNITPVGGSCSDVSSKNLIVTAVTDPYWNNVVLLMHFDGANGSTIFTDQKGHTFSNGGTSSISNALSKFGGSSLLLNGSSYIQTPALSDWNFGTGDFTIEFFVKFNNIGAGVYTPGNQYFMDIGSNNMGIRWYSGSGWDIWTNTTVISSTEANPGTSNWIHIVYQRSGNTFRVYKNGILTTTSNYSGSLGSNNILRIGNHGGDPSYGLNGYMDELRITKGVARYTANFTPPTEAYPNQ
ncbi:MAG: LamG domain-containing protein, partial [Candidatus Gracilibacteria bacterium]|nr:LamG domain-containing protein [Candidatus Gracilibacteria bacterium]